MNKQFRDRLPLPMFTTDVAIAASATSICLTRPANNQQKEANVGQPARKR
jgi:hypothetical protein